MAEAVRLDAHAVVDDAIAARLAARGRFAGA
jgi:hypothetical protein